MKAVIRRRGALVVDHIDAPTPGQGEVLVRTLACGICGSDLHIHHHCTDVLPLMKKVVPAANFFDPEQDVVFGHEFCAEVLDYGPNSQRAFKLGTRVCAVPVVVTPGGVGTVGYVNRYPGGFGEQMVLQEPMLVEVPGDLPTEIAALTEPMAVGVHAVNLAKLTGNEAALVIGCGPIGLATIIALKSRGIGPIVAADFSPRRRALAEKLGADVVVDPAEKSPYRSWYEVAAPADFDPDSVAALLSMGPQPRPCVVFECVGVPGVLNAIFTGAPRNARVVVVGVCMKTDGIDPMIAINKELNLQFSHAYTLPEFTETLRQLADGKLQAADLITDIIAPEQVPAAFDELGKADHQAKVIVKMS